MSLPPKWLMILKMVGLGALKASPLAPIAGAVEAGIAAAEAIPGATGQEKLDHVLNIATQAAIVAQQSGVKIDPEMVKVAGANAISTAVQVTNIVHAVHADSLPDPTPAV